jgi:acyl dehydratase
MARRSYSGIVARGRDGRGLVNFNLAKIGEWVASDEYAPTADEIAEYARAINDTVPAHLAGELAPPLFAVRFPVSRTMKRANDLVSSVFCLHGEHDIHFHRQITPGMTLQARASVVGVHQRKAGVAIVIRCETRTAAGELLNEQYETTFAHHHTIAAGAGEEAPDHRMPHGVVSRSPTASLTYEMTSDQTRRYAEASGDRSAYTMDDEAARALGLPGAIAHGLLTMAFCSRAIVASACYGDSTTLSRLAVRFSGLVPVRAGQALTTRVWQVGERDGRSAFAFVAAEASGVEVIRHGLAEVAT